MAHELDSVLTFFKSFGDDNFRHPVSGTVHRMSEYAWVISKFIEREIVILKNIAVPTEEAVSALVTSVVNEVIEDTNLNVVEAKEEIDTFSQPLTTIVSPVDPVSVEPRA